MPADETAAALADAVRQARAELLRAQDALSAADAFLAAVEGQGDASDAVASYLDARRLSLYSASVAHSTGLVLDLAHVVTSA